MSLAQSVSKFKSLLPLAKTDLSNLSINRKTNDRSEPEVGFKLTFEPSGTPSTADGKNGKKTNSEHQVPQLNVLLIGARHLPTSFGLKSVEGYMIKVKLFPGATKYDSSIQTASWPKFNETFRFPLVTAQKSSFKLKHREPSTTENLPEHYFKGNFVVLTVFALLELPPGTGSGIKEKVITLKRQGSLMLKDNPFKTSTPEQMAAKAAAKAAVNEKTELAKKGEHHVPLTRSESQRNLGSVTYFLDPKIFEENLKTKTFSTDEFWLPIKDITMASEKKASIGTSPKGQVEITLQLCETLQLPATESGETPEADSASLNSRNDSIGGTRRRFSFNDMKRMVKIKKKDKTPKGLTFKLTVSRMRASIKVKEEIESVAELIYVKTTVLEHDILSKTWKSNVFAPSLSTRWNPDDSTICVPMASDAGLNYVDVKISVATKTKVGKKIVLGSLLMGPNTTGSAQDHWHSMIASRGEPVTMWHNFE